MSAERNKSHISNNRHILQKCSLTGLLGHIHNTRSGFCGIIFSNYYVPDAFKTINKVLSFHG